MTAQVGSQAQAASVVVKAGSSSTVSVSAKPADGAAAGDYPITVDATSGSRSAHADLSVDDHRQLQARALDPGPAPQHDGTAGSATDLTLTLTNSGTADIDGVAHDRDRTDRLEVDFDPPSVTVPAGTDGQGRRPHDAVVRRHRRRLRRRRSRRPHRLANASTDIRVTIQTSLLWGDRRDRADRRSCSSACGGPSAGTAADERGRGTNGRPAVQPGDDAGPSHRGGSSRAGHPDAPADQAATGR